MHTPSRRPPAAGFKRRLLAIVVIGAVCLLAGLAVRLCLYKTADVPEHFPPARRANAPFIVTPDPVVERMVEAAGLSEGDLVYDLGCGDGRIVIAAALNSGCEGVGFDIDPQRVAEARKNAAMQGVEDRVQIVEQDILTVNLGKADVAMMYLLPWMMNELLPQFEQMKPGCRIVSHEFWIHGVEPDEVILFPSGADHDYATIYRYVTPLKMDPNMERGKPPRPADWTYPQAGGR
jgi:SAM-dependent methyltransferase